MMTSLFLGRDAFIDFSISVTGIWLIIPALFWLFFSEQERSISINKKNYDSTPHYLFWLIVVPLGLLICPGSSILIQKLLGASLINAMIAIPTALVTIYVFIHLTKRLNIIGKRWLGASVCLAILIVVASSLPIRYAYPMGFNLISNKMKIDPEVLEICSIVGSDQVLLPKEVLGQTGEFDSQIHAIPLKKMDYDDSKAFDIGKMAVDSNVNLIVIRKTYDLPWYFDFLHYSKTAETEHYVIYQRSDE